MTAATSCAWYMTVSVGSTICLSPASVGIQCRPAFSRSRPVMTARTPGIASAAEASMLTIVAWAYGLRTIDIQVWFLRLTSSMYSPCPRMNRGSSLRLRLVGRHGSLLRRLDRDGGRGLRTQLAGGLVDRLHDVHVAGAAAEVAGDAVADLVLGRVGVLLQEPGGLHDHPRGAEAALEPVLVQDRLRGRVGGPALPHPLDRGDLAAVRLDGKHRAALRAATVHRDGAGAARGAVATDVRPGQPEVLAQHVDKQPSRLDVGLVASTVHRDGNVHRAGHWSRPPSQAPARARARRSALTAISPAIARLYSTGPWPSCVGLLPSDAARRTAASSSTDGRAPTSAFSAASSANGVGATAVSAMPAAAIVPPGARVTWTAAAAVAKSPALRSVFSYAPPEFGGGSGTRTSVRISVGSMAVTNVSTKNSRAGITRSRSRSRTTMEARLARSTAGQSDEGSAWATDPPRVPQLRTWGSPTPPAASDQRPER